MDEKQLNAICEPTRLKLLGLLAEQPLTNTEAYEKLKGKGIVYRESVFKALKVLKDAGLVKRTFEEKKGYKYSLNFKRLPISSRLAIIRD